MFERHYIEFSQLLPTLLKQSCISRRHWASDVSDTWRHEVWTTHLTRTMQRVTDRIWQHRHPAKQRRTSTHLHVRLHVMMMKYKHTRVPAWRHVVTTLDCSVRQIYKMYMHQACKRIYIHERCYFYFFIFFTYLHCNEVRTLISNFCVQIHFIVFRASASLGWHTPTRALHCALHFEFSANANNTRYKKENCWSSFDTKQNEQWTIERSNPSNTNKAVYLVSGSDLIFSARSHVV